MSKIKILLGKRIKELRLAKKMTQENLSELTGIGTPSISKIESGIYHPSDDNLERIAEVLGVEPYRLYLYGHLKNSDEIKSDLCNKIQNADEKTLRIAYKVLSGLFE